MSQFDHLDLDGRLLRLLVAIVEERSITRAGHRLDVTQSAVSHLLDKLRAIVGDPIVARAGRGIVPTARAETLAARARVLLGELQRFAHSGAFEPASLRTTFTIAANDLQRDLLLPSLLARLRAEAAGLVMRVIPSAVPTLELFRDEHCQLAVSPRPPEASDIVAKRLFVDRYCVYYDAAIRSAPATLEDYLAAEHVTVVYEPRRAVEIDDVLAARGIERRVVAMVPGMAGLAAFVRGSARIATAPSLLCAESMRGLARAPVPFATPEMPMFALWHLRYQDDPVHRWVRRHLEACVAI